MTKDEFLALPPAVALRVLFDCLDVTTKGAISHTEKIKLPLPPKYDGMIYRQGGYQWASETSLEGLRFWHKRAVESAEKGGPYADKDRKQAAGLARWIGWRECFIETVWSGLRNDDAVTASPPSDKPAAHQRSGGGQRKAAPAAEDTSFDPENF